MHMIYNFFGLYNIVYTTQADVYIYHVLYIDIQHMQP